MTTTAGLMNDCGCCAGVSVETPLAVVNRPGLSAIAYRIGTHARFKASMLARLAESGRPALARLQTRDDDDFTIALLDAWAIVLDVLTFYQERIANESYLRTATERGSIVNLSRLIGYELRPGVAASTYLAFTLDSGPGAPDSLTIDTGVRAQSIPGPGETPQSFETVEEVAARPEWNTLRPQQAALRYPAFGDVEMYLTGVATNLKPGDPILIVGAERAADKGNENWEIRRVSKVDPDAAHNRTRVRWQEPLGSVLPHVDPPKVPTVYALRVQASLFGFNAPRWDALPVALRVGEKNPDPSENAPGFLAGAYAGRQNSWAEARLASVATTINLDSVYSPIVLGSWIVLVKPAETKSPADAEVFRVGGVAAETQADFNVTAKTTRLAISGENIGKFSPRDTTVLAQSEALDLAETPLDDPLAGDVIVLDRVVDGLEPKRTLVLTGRRTRAVIGATRVRLFLTAADNTQRVQLSAGDTVTVLADLPDLSQPGSKVWHLSDSDGFDGFVTAPDGRVTLVGASATDEVVTEVVQIKAIDNDSDHTRLTLEESLQHVYDRTTVAIAGNVAPATHGETVKDEVLGSGDASQPYQSFTLKRAPLTYLGADTPSGGASTLEVRVNDLSWTEVPALFGHGPRDRVYITRIADDGTTTVEFGDGETGARLPIGHENVSATYRKGIGLAGLMKAGKISLLMTRPLGLKAVVNPVPAAGAQDPQNFADARANSPLTVLTLDRIVSLLDYENFARSFAGVAKSIASWTWSGHSRGVFLTVAGVDGAAIAEDSTLHDHLLAAIQAAGDAWVPVVIRSYRGVTFKLVGDVKVDETYRQELVLAAVEAALRTTFSFAARAFGQPVTLSEVIAVMQNVPGVVAVDVNKLYRGAVESLASFLPADTPQPGDADTVPAAELLTLDPAPVELRVMP